MTWINLPAEYRNLRTPPVLQGKETAPRWYEFRNQTEDEAELLIFSEIGGWFGVWADEFVEELNQVTAPRLTLRLNSPGGSVWHGVAIANALRAHPASVTVRVEGLAASIASVIAMAGDKLIMAPNSMFMIHDASTATWGDAAEMRKTAEVLDKISDNLADAYAAKAGGTRADWRALMLAETWYTPAEAVAAGLADELMVPPKEPEEPEDAAKLMSARWDLTVFRYAGRQNAPAPALRAPAAPAAPTADDAALEVVRAGVKARAAAEPTPTAPAAPAAAPTDQAPAPAPASTPIDARPHPTADEQPGPAPEPVAQEATGDEPTWGELVAHLTAPPSADDLLAHLREAM